jgi:hypothetical protein
VDAGKPAASSPWRGISNSWQRDCRQRIGRAVPAGKMQRNLQKITVMKHGEFDTADDILDLGGKSVGRQSISREALSFWAAACVGVVDAATLSRKGNAV